METLTPESFDQILRRVAYEKDGAFKGREFVTKSAEKYASQQYEKGYLKGREDQYKEDKNVPQF